MQIRMLSINDVPECERIYREAREFMRASGNDKQWTGGYPTIDIINSDIDKGRLFGVFDGEEQVGVFCFFVGEDETYKRIYDGEWLTSSEEYGVIHRIAISNAAHGLGIASLCFEFAADRAGSVRIDTHRDNIPMQRSLSKNGFSKCGIIYLLSGDERIAYEKCKQKL